MLNQGVIVGKINEIITDTKHIIIMMKVEDSLIPVAIPDKMVSTLQEKLPDQVEDSVVGIKGKLVNLIEDDFPLVLIAEKITYLSSKRD